MTGKSTSARNRCLRRMRPLRATRKDYKMQHSTVMVHVSCEQPGRMCLSWSCPVAFCIMQIRTAQLTLASGGHAWHGPAAPPPGIAAGCSAARAAQRPRASGAPPRSAPAPAAPGPPYRTARRPAASTPLQDARKLTEHPPEHTSAGSGACCMQAGQPVMTGGTGAGMMCQEAC